MKTLERDPVRGDLGAGPLLSAERLSGGYGDRLVVREVSLTLCPGQLLGLVGPNGAGKSTLMRLLSGVLAPRQGSVSLMGRDLAAVSAGERARLIAYVPQSEPALFDFTVREVVLMGRYSRSGRFARLDQRDYEAAAQAMARMDVLHLAARPITTLSGGEHRRVLIARALAQEAPVLLMDEPTAHLDMTHQSDVLSTLSHLCLEKQSAALVALHDLNLAAEWCDRMMLLSGGSAVAFGPPETVLEPDVLSHAYGASVTVARHPVTGRPLASPAFREAAGTKALPHVHVICGGGTGAELLALLVRRGFPVTVGVLNELDSDEEAARALGIRCVCERPFSPISDASFDEALELIADGSIVVISDIPIGHGNLRNVTLALEAARRGHPVLLLSQTPVEERDFTGGAAT